MTTTIDRLNEIIQTRLAGDHEGSYTVSLARSGLKRCAQKVGEEGVEVALAALAGDKKELTNETADLLYHLLVLLNVADLPLGDVLNELEQRMKP